MLVIDLGREVSIIFFTSTSEYYSNCYYSKQFVRTERLLRRKWEGNRTRLIGYRKSWKKRKKKGNRGSHKPNSIYSKKGTVPINRRIG